MVGSHPPDSGDEPLLKRRKTQDPTPRAGLEDEDTLCDYEMVHTPDTPTSGETLAVRAKEKSDGEGLRLDLHPLPGQDGVIVSVQPPTGKARVPCDVVLIIDISGSMGAAAPAPAMSNGEKEVDGLTVLDLTKHAARAIIETMGDDDRLGVVTFTDDARVILPLTQMTKTNKTKAWDLVKPIRPQGMTNLWHGILEGKGLLDGKQRSGAMPAMLLLTDGIPNRSCPPQGYVPRLQTYDLPAPIHCFGFGYGIGSCLLQSIAEVTSGNFAFISDASMLATVFIHAIANFQSTFAQGAHLTITASDGLQLAQTMGEYIRTDEQPAKKPEDDYQATVTIPLGSIQLGQSREIFLRYGGRAHDANVKPTITAELTCRPLDPAAAGSKLSATCRTGDTCGLDAADVAFHRNRAAFCSFATSLAPIGKGRERERHEHDFPQKRTELQQLIARIQEQKLRDPANAALLEDLTEQITLAVSEQYIGSWGFHYLLSMYNAHFKQLCMSFKDPGQLQYSTQSPVFAAARNALSDLFDTLPPPAATVTIRDKHGVTRKVARNMNWYNSSKNPCFAAHTPVRMADGSHLAICKLRQGSAVWTPAGARRVAAVLETAVADAVLACIGDLQVTPWHPIVADGTWTFPARVATQAMWYTGDIYSVLLEADADPAAHALQLCEGSGSVVAVTLGHGIWDTEDVRAHPFFANHAAVTAALHRLPEYDCIARPGVRRGAGTRKGPDGHVVGFETPLLVSADGCDDNVGRSTTLMRLLEGGVAVR